MSKFSLHFLSNGNWSVKNSQGEWWTGDHDWVHPNSSYWQLDWDCWNHEFSFEELRKFIEENFNVNI